jgi:hypothetical protein
MLSDISVIDKANTIDVARLQDILFTAKIKTQPQQKSNKIFLHSEDRTFVRRDNVLAIVETTHKNKRAMLKTQFQERSTTPCIVPPISLFHPNRKRKVFTK